MNIQTQTLLQKVNEKIRTKPLIYFSREAERAIGLETVLQNYHICCSEYSPMVDELESRGVSIFCLEKETSEASDKSTVKLLDNELVKEWIKKISNNYFYGITFSPTKTIEFKIQKLGGEFLGNEGDYFETFENKINQTKFFKNSGFSIPRTIVEEIQKLEYENLAKEFSNKFIIQTAKSHTGIGTHFIETESEFNLLKEKLSGNIVRVSEFIDGISMTINVCIFNNNFYISSPQFQITGIEELTSGKGTTVGNDFLYGYKFLRTSDSLFLNTVKQIEKISKVMIERKYRGIFGIDFIVKKDKVYIIEINARQTANIPFQTKLELNADYQVPLMLLHLAELLYMDLEVNYEHMTGIKASQIFLRAKKDNIRIENNFKSGVYRLQSDNSAIEKDNFKDREVKDSVIFIDEENDKPLIFQKSGYSIEDIENGGFLISFQASGQSKNISEEIVRMQFKDGIVTEQGIKPWVIEALKSIEGQIIFESLN